jgi:hypothetical protein
MTKQDMTPAAEDIERVLELIPAQWRTENCRRAVTRTIRTIATLAPDVAPAGAARRQLRRLATVLGTARSTINHLPARWRRELEPDGLLRELDRVRRTSDALAGKMVVRRSGGSPARRVVAAQKREAAECAFDLLNDWGPWGPKLTKGGAYVELAGLLFQLATGRSEDMERACTDCLKDLERGGYPDAAERRRWRREAESQPERWGVKADYD